MEESVSWIKNKSTRRPAEKLRVREIQFIEEQDGDAERDLKAKLVTLFDQLRLVRIAYLARVQYDSSDSVDVAVCVRGQRGQDRMVAERVGQVFASIFARDQHCDIMWITPEQETALTKVCRPFYKMDASVQVAAHFSSPNTPTPFVVPTYTFPFAMVGVMYLLPLPKWSRLLTAWLLL